MIIDARDLYRTFVSRGSDRVRRVIPAIDHVSFRVEAGEFVAVIGPNGAGKTTLLRLLSGILWPTSGHLEVLGAQPWRRPHRFRCQIGLIAGQRSALVPELPATATFEYHRALYGIGDRPFRERLATLTDRLDLGALLPRRVRELSLGQRVRLDVALVLAHSPALLLLDEPTLGLDVLTKVAVREFLAAENRQGNTTMVLTSHDTEDLELCSRVLLLDNGQVQYDGDLTKFFGQHPREVSVVVRFREASPALGDALRDAGFTIEEGQWRRRCTADEVGPTVAHASTLGQMAEIRIEEPGLTEVLSRIYARLLGGTSR